MSHLKYTAYRNKISFKLGQRPINARKYVRCARTFYLLSSEIKSEGSIAIVKKFDFDLFMFSIIYYSHILKKKCFIKISLCVCLSDRRRSQSLKQSIGLVKTRYLESSCKYLQPFFFRFYPTPKIKGSSHEKRIKKFDFLKNGSNDFD